MVLTLIPGQQLWFVCVCVNNERSWNTGFVVLSCLWQCPSDCDTTMLPNCVYSRRLLITVSVSRRRQVCCVLVWVKKYRAMADYTCSSLTQVDGRWAGWLELLVVSWNLKLFLEILENSRNLVDTHGKMTPVWAQGRCIISPPVSWPSVVRGNWTRVVLFCYILGCLLFLICIEFICIFLYCFVCQYQSSDWLWRPPPVSSGALNSTPTNQPRKWHN